MFPVNIASAQLDMSKNQRTWTF